jgi:hypothetical protein
MAGQDLEKLILGQAPIAQSREKIVGYIRK